MDSQEREEFAKFLKEEGENLNNIDEENLVQHKTKVESWFTGKAKIEELTRKFKKKIKLTQMLAKKGDAEKSSLANVVKKMGKEAKN